MNARFFNLAGWKAKIKSLPLIGPCVAAIWGLLTLPAKINVLIASQTQQQQALDQLKQSTEVMRASLGKGVVFATLDSLLAKVEYYQPLYNCSISNSQKAQRICVDRADAVHQQMQIWGSNAHILDIGCSLGYFSFYFSERNYLVDGIDNNPNNIAICQFLQQQVRNDQVQFSTNEFSHIFLENIQPDQYDIVFLFSVLHHLVHAKGLPYVQDLVKQLLEKIPILFVELVIRQEDTRFPWLQSLPEDELALFSKCSDITIQKLGSFQTHVSRVKRPLYLVMRNVLHHDNQAYKIYGRKFRAYYGAPRIPGRCFYDCGDKYIKRYRIGPPYPDNLKQISQEIENYQSLPNNDFFAKLLSHKEQQGTIDLVFEKLPGENLHDLLSKGKEQDVQPLLIFTGIIKALEFLLQHGLYHNDLRVWNIMFDGTRPYFVDLCVAGAEETESTNSALSWIIAQLHHFVHHEPHPVNTFPDLTQYPLPPLFNDIVDALKKMQNFTAFLEWFRQAKLSYPPPQPAS